MIRLIRPRNAPQSMYQIRMLAMLLYLGYIMLVGHVASGLGNVEVLIVAALLYAVVASLMYYWLRPDAIGSQRMAMLLDATAVTMSSVHDPAPPMPALLLFLISQMDYAIRLDRREFNFGCVVVLSGLACCVVLRALYMSPGFGLFAAWTLSLFLLLNVYAVLMASKRHTQQEDSDDLHHRHQLITQLSGNFYWIANANGEIEYCNQGMLDFLGLDADALRDEKPFSRFHPDDLESLKSCWNNSLERGTAFEHEARILRYDDVYRWFLVRAVAQHDDDGQVQQWYGSNVDITDLKHAQHDAELASRAKTTFLSTMSHEIRTPMNAIIGMAGLLDSKGLSAEQQDLTRVIRQSGRHLLGVINDILDFSMLESGKLRLEKAPFCVEALIADALEIVAPLAREKNLKLAYDVLPDIWQWAIGDANRIRQILVNFLGNAIKFTDTGQIIIVARATPDKEGRIHLRFEVQDSGPGIDPDNLSSIFEAFEMEHNQGRNAIQGTGLGLAINRHLARNLGGKVDVKSTLGKGSTFSFEVGLETLKNVPKRRKSDVPGLLNGLRVWVFEPNVSLRAILKRNFQSWGARVLTADSIEDFQRWYPADASCDIAFFSAHLQVDPQQVKQLCPAALIVREQDGAQSDADKFNSKDGLCEQVVVRTPIRLGHLRRVMEPKERQAVTQHASPETLTQDMAAKYPLQILVVEDNALNARVLVMTLERMGYKPSVAGNGYEAIESVERQHYDLVFMDVEMPKMDGIEATKRIVENHEADDRPYIVALTAGVLQDERQRCLDAGMDEFLAKPVNLDELINSLGRCFTEHTVRLA